MRKRLPANSKQEIFLKINKFSENTGSALGIGNVIVIHASKIDKGIMCKINYIDQIMYEESGKKRLFFLLFLLYHSAWQNAMHKFIKFCITLYITKCTTKFS